MIEGGCFCGAIRYAIEDAKYVVANCHCSMCRRTSGAPFVTWMVVPGASFEYLRGDPQVLNSSDDGTRYFCSQCGTPIACVNGSHPDQIDVTTGSLDDPAAFPATVAVHEDSKLPWLSLTESPPA
jgi:hypothetical protein